MDALLWELIEAEGAADLDAERLTDDDLSPVAVVDEGDGWIVEVYADGSSVTLPRR